MSLHEIIELQDARPFHPFELTLSDGARLVVAHPKWMLITPNGRTLHCVFQDAPSRRVDVEHITRRWCWRMRWRGASPGRDEPGRGGVRRPGSLPSAFFTFLSLARQSNAA